MTSGPVDCELEAIAAPTARLNDTLRGSRGSMSMPRLGSGAGALSSLGTLGAPCLSAEPSFDHRGDDNRKQGSDHSDDAEQAAHRLILAAPPLVRTSAIGHLRRRASGDNVLAAAAPMGGSLGVLGAVRRRASGDNISTAASSLAAAPLLLARVQRGDQSKDGAAAAAASVSIPRPLTSSALPPAAGFRGSAGASVLAAATAAAASAKAASSTDGSNSGSGRSSAAPESPTPTDPPSCSPPSSWPSSPATAADAEGEAAAAGAKTLPQKLPTPCGIRLPSIQGSRHSMGLVVGPPLRM